MTSVVVLTAFCASPVWAKPISKRLRTALRSSSPRVRVAAVVAVSKSKGDDARSLLENALGDKAEVVRASAVEGLGRLGDPQALPAVRAMLRDKSGLVRKLTPPVIAMLEKVVIPSGLTVLEIGIVRNETKRTLPGAQDRLRQKLTASLVRDGRRGFQIQESARGGYGLLLKLTGLAPFEQPGVKGIQLTCDLTVVELPNRSLRMSSSATTGAGTTVAVDEAKINELALDAVDACAPELAKDFVDFLIKREGR